MGVPHPGAGHGPGSLPVARTQRHHDLSEGQQRSLREDADQVEKGVALQDRAQLVAPLQRLQRHRVPGRVDARHLERHGPARHRFPMAHARIGSYHDTRPRHLAAPGKVEVLTHGEDAGVEPLQLAPQVGTYEDAAARRHEHVPYGVVLAVVHLSVLNAVHHCPGLVAVHADVEQDRGVVPVDELR